MPQLKILDKAAQKNKPTSRLLTASEYAKIFPTAAPRRIGLVFKQFQGLNVDTQIAYAFIKKYPSIIAIDDEGKPTGVCDTLDDMTYAELVKLGPYYDISHIGKSKIKLRSEIRQARANGVKPYTEEQLAKVKKEKQDAYRKRYNAKRPPDIPHTKYHLLSKANKAKYNAWYAAHDPNHKPPRHSKPKPKSKPKSKPKP